MVGSRSEKRRWLRGVTARPKLSICFALLSFLVLVAAAKVASPLAPATAVVEIRPNAFREQIGALDVNWPEPLPEPMTIKREIERLRSVGMARTVLDRLSEDIPSILAEDVSLVSIWLSTPLARLCAHEGVLGAMVRPVCGVLSSGASRTSAALAGMREALSVVGDVEDGRLAISFSTTDPDRAAAMANLYATTYVQQRLEDKQRLRRRVEAEVMLARMMHAARPPGNNGEGLTQAASDALQDPGSDPADAAGAAADSRAAQDGHDGFLHRTESLLADPAWTDPPAVIVAAASPPPRSALLAGGLAAAVGGLVSLVIGVALGTLVDIVWPAGERRPSFYDNPYWPQSGDEPGTQLIATKGLTRPITSSSAEGR